MSSEPDTTAGDGEGGDRLLGAILNGLGMPDEGDLDTGDDETLLHSEACNRTQNRRRAVGGRLSLTDRRLVFRPHDFDAGLSGRGCEIALADVASVDTHPATRNPIRALRRPLDTLFGGGLRIRLAVETLAGDTELFVVSDPEATAATVREAVEAAGDD